jgi:hypothetical protein
LKSRVLRFAFESAQGEPDRVPPDQKTIASLSKPWEIHISVSYFIGFLLKVELGWKDFEKSPIGMRALAANSPTGKIGQV